MNFASPFFLPLLIFVIIFAVWYFFIQKRRQKAYLIFSNIKLAKSVYKKKNLFIKRHLNFILRLIVLTLLILAVSRPQGVFYYPTKDLDIVLCFDISGSMMATDYPPNREEAAKSAARVFVNQLKGNYRLAIVTFNSFARIVLDATHNRSDILDAINSIKAARGATAIGDAISTSLSILSTLKSTNKVIILLSDGENNRGVSPLVVAKYAKQQKVVIYTIGIGSKGAYVPSIGQIVGVDEYTLKKIASITGGKYFKADNSDVLKKVFKDLGRKVGFIKKYQDISLYFVWAALFFLLIDIILSVLYFISF